jgi:hypothetical protein
VYQSAALARTISEPVSSFVSQSSPPTNAQAARLSISRESSYSPILSSSGISSNTNSSSSSNNSNSNVSLTTASDGRASVGEKEVWERMESDPPSANDFHHNHAPTRWARVNNHRRAAARQPTAAAPPVRGEMIGGGGGGGSISGSISSVARSASLGRNNSCPDTTSRPAGCSSSQGHFRRSASLDLIASRRRPLPESEEDEDESADQHRKVALPPPPHQQPYKRARTSVSPENERKGTATSTASRRSSSLLRNRQGILPPHQQRPSSPYVVDAEDVRYHMNDVQFPSNNRTASFSDLLEAVHRVGDVGKKADSAIPACKATACALNASPGMASETTSEEEEWDGDYEADKTFSSIDTSLSAKRSFEFFRDTTIDKVDRKPETAAVAKESPCVDGRGLAKDKLKSSSGALDERDRECANWLLGLGAAS